MFIGHAAKSGDVVQGGHDLGQGQRGQDPVQGQSAPSGHDPGRNGHGGHVRKIAQDGERTVPSSIFLFLADMEK